MVIKKPEANDEEDEEFNKDDALLHDHITEKDLKDPKKLQMLEARKLAAPLPPELDFLNTAKQER